MTASATDYFQKVGSPGNATSLAAPGHIIGGTAFTVDSTSLWPTDTGVTFAIDTTTLVNGVETRVAGSYTVWSGVVSSATTITGCVLRYGTDQAYSAGSTTRVYVLPTSTRENRQVDGILVGHTQTGAHIADLPLTTPKITTGIKDSSGNTVIPFTGSSSTTSVKLSTTAVGPTYVESGCVWTADAAGSTRNASMTAGVVYINGVRLTVAAVTARSFTASKDVYVDFTNNADGTALISYIDTTTNAASPALTTAGATLRNAIVVVGATNIAAAASINQGQETALVPITSSIPYAVTDSLGNLVNPRDSSSKLLGYRQVTGDQSTSSGAYSDVTGLSLFVVIPAGRKVRVIVKCGAGYNSTDTNGGSISVYDATASVQLDQSNGRSSGANGEFCLVVDQVYTPPASGARNFKVLFAATVGGLFHTNAAAGLPMKLLVELT